PPLCSAFARLAYECATKKAHLDLSNVPEIARVRDQCLILRFGSAMIRALEGHDPGTLLAKVHDRRAAPHALHPEILDPWDVGGDVIRRHDYLGVERFINTVAGPIEVGLQHNRRVAGRSGLRRFASGAGALECRLGQQRCRIPADALPCEARARVVWIDAYAQRSLLHILEAAKASGRVD